MNVTKITVSVNIQAPIERVWEYFTSPKHITQWNFATEDWHCPWATNELWPGGKYVARMEAKDGSFGFDFEAVYDTVRDKEEISYTMGDGRKATTLFKNKGPTTYVETTFDAESENPIELQKNGWQAILDNFKKYVEAN